MLERRFRFVAAAVLALAVLGGSVAGPAAAAPATPEHPQGRPTALEPAGPELGVVPLRGQAPNRNGGSGGNLVNHGGPTMQTGNTTYAVYWWPTAYGKPSDSDYDTLINRFFQDVAAASLANSRENTYYSDTQYSNITYRSTFGGAYLDTTPFPTSGCTDSVAATSVCLSDKQLMDELAAAITAAGWQGNIGPTSAFFLFTPLGVGNCSGSSCAFSNYCAYHSWFTHSAANKTVIWANQPYTETVSGACGSGQSPNFNQPADSTINVLSHEHNEMITDPQGSAWFDLRGYENADKCAWNFGAALGGGGGALYNQLINTHPYYVQQNWSNKSKACVLRGQ